MTVHPGLAVYIVNAVRPAVSGQGQSASMASRAFRDFASVTLNRRSGQIVIGLLSRPFGMRAAVAGFTCYAVMPDAVPIQCIVLLGETLVSGNNKGCRVRAVGIGDATDDLGAQMIDCITRMAGLAHGQVGPGTPGCLAHRSHGAVTVGTDQACCRHGPSGALCFFTRMAKVTDVSAGRRLGYNPRSMKPVGGLGHGLIHNLRPHWPGMPQIQRRGIVAGRAENRLALEKVRSVSVIV